MRKNLTRALLVLFALAAITYFLWPSTPKASQCQVKTWYEFSPSCAAQGHSGELMCTQLSDCSVWCRCV